MADEPDTTDPTTLLPAALAYSLRDDGVKNPALAEKYLTERRTRGAKYAADYEDVMSQRQAEVENAKRILDEAAAAMRASHTGAGQWQMNLPLLQMAAGFFKPTKTGNFGEEFSNALTGLGAGVAHQRMSDTEFEKGMADLMMKRSTLAQEPLKDRAALLKAQQLAEEQGARSIETAQVKTGAGGSEPAELKLYNAAKNSSPDPSKFPDFDTWRSLSAGKKEYAKVSAREAAEAAASLPQLEAQAQSFREQIDKILDPNNRQHLLSLIGVLDGRIPEALITNPKTQDMLAALKTLEAMTFGEAVAKMKGLGALSNAEGQKIQNILGTLNRKGTPKEFIDVLMKMRDSTSVIASEVAKKKSEWSGSSSTSSPASAAPKPPAPVDYRSLYKLD